MSTLRTSRKTATKKSLPPSFRPMFWSYRFRDLDKKKDAPLVVKQILMYGDLPQWRWMMKQYGTRTIRAVLSKTYQTELRPSLVELAKTVFNVTPHARRVPHQRS